MKVQHIIIGAGRSGTTSLVAYLKQHAEVNFSNIKEVTYFSVDDHFKRGEAHLHSFFEKDNGLASTSDTYLLQSKDAPKRMAEYNPAMKIAVILREPAARTYSNYHFSVNHGYIKEETSLLESQKLEAEYLKSDDIIAQNNHCNFDGSLYAKHLNYWLQYFPKEQFFVCTTNELSNDPQGLMLRYFEFLGLAPFKVEPLEAQHKAAGVKNKSLNSFLVNRDHWLRNIIRGPLQLKPIRKLVLNSSVVDKLKQKNRAEMEYTPMTTEELNFCEDYFKEDLAELAKVFGVTF